MCAVNVRRKLKRRGAAREVGACAEGSPAAGDDDDPNLIVGIGPIESIDQVEHHLRGKGIELFRPVERDGQDFIRHLVKNGFVFQQRSPDQAM